MPGAQGGAVCKRALPRESEMDHEKIEWRWESLSRWVYPLSEEMQSIIYSPHRHAGCLTMWMRDTQTCL